MSQYKLCVRLKQHTPIIHFQHEQEGATIRATELKPKLDRFIILELGKSWNEIKPDWKIGAGKTGHESLNYKVKVNQGGEKKGVGRGTPMFFANIGQRNNSNKEKKPVYYPSNSVELIFFSFCTEIIGLIKKYLASFLAITNFGMRQSKGYGSFYIDRSDDLYVPIDQIIQYQTKFEIKTNNWWIAMGQLDLFYKMLRSGINEVKEPGVREIGNDIVNSESNSKLYCKPVIFLYAMQKLKRQWDKKTIKAHFFSDDYYVREIKENEGKKIKERLRLNRDIDEILELGFPIQKEKFPDKKGPLHYDEPENNDTKLLLRDLFGLSTEQTWRSYSATIKKVHKSNDKDNAIVRMKSPLTFKLIFDSQENSFDVYVLASPVPGEVLGSEFEVSATSNRKQATKKLPGPISLMFPEKFDWGDFFDFLKNDFEFDSAFQNVSNSESYQQLKTIFDQIQNEKK